jgi:arylsulfatase A-like enzyme
VGGPNEFDDGELEYILASYAGEVTHCDDYVGILFDKVKEMELWDETVIALVSDHGHNIMDHGIMHKIPDHMYNELMDLVYIIKSPGSANAGKECNAYVAHHDIPITLMEMAGIKPPEGLDGANVWMWASGAKQTRSYATCIFHPWLWTKDSEYVYMTDIERTSEKLYDIKNDPKEMNNIASEHPDLCNKFRERLWDEASGDLPLYDVIRHGHEWYEYPDIHDPTGTFSESLTEKRDERKRKD